MGTLFLLFPSDINFKEENINLKFAERKSSFNFIPENTETKKTNQIPWKNVAEYDEFVRSTVNKHYASDIGEIYTFYNIKRELPKYGFKARKNEITCFDCEGAVYKENVDSIYFYSTCSEYLFGRYLKYSKKTKENIKEELINRLHYYIKHEGAHAFYYALGKELGEKYLFNVQRENTSVLYDIQHNLVEEGVADYIAYKGELTQSAKRLTDEDFKEMIENKTDIYLYDLGFILVKPILDKNFEKGIIELIKNPLNKRDLDDLPRYREKILKKL